MNTEQAKFLLRVYRANGADAFDPNFAEALELARQDAGLREWLACEQALDGAVSAKLREVAAPTGLREAILAGAQATASDTSQRSWWRRPVWLSAAAGFVVLFSVLGLWTNRSSAAAETLPEFAAAYVAEGFFLNRHSADLGELRAWLTRQNAPLPAEVPAGFTQLRSLGCKTLKYRGKDVTLLCFGEGKEYHLFVARRGDFPAMPTEATPRLVTQKGHATATWSDDQHHFVVVTDDSLKALKECLECERS